jgi:hypothetical protein
VINYWLTFTHVDRRLSERLAVRVSFSLDDGECHCPAFGLAITGTPRALIEMLPRVAAAVAERFGLIQQGMMTQAMNTETRHILLAADGERVFTDARYAVENAARAGGLDTPLI